MDKEDLSLRFNYIKKKLKDRRVIIYGAGKFFQDCIEKYDFSDLNIIGITDRKFIQEDKGKKFCGFPVILNSEFYTDTDLDIFVLLMLEKPKPSLRVLKLKGFRNYISFVDTSEKLSTKLAQKFIPKFIRKFFYIYIYGKKKKKQNNTFVLIKRDGTKVYNPKIKNLMVKFYGANSYFELHEPFNFAKETCCFRCLANSKTIIGANTRFESADIHVGENSTLKIGKSTTFKKNLFIVVDGENTISIGDECMFSWDIIIRSHDAHTIYDTETKEIINPMQNVEIGNHIWACTRVVILKGAKIPSNSVLGINSVINKPFEEENCVIAGMPAKVVKTNINWDKRFPKDFCTMDTVEEIDS